MSLKGKLLAGLSALLMGTAVVAEEPKELNLFIWPAYVPDELIEQFTQETGIKVTMDYYDSNEALLAKLKAGATGYDVVVAADYIIPVMIEEGVLQAFDAPSLPNFANVADRFKTPWYDEKREYTAPYMWGTTGIVYDSAKTGGELEHSWKVFFEPDGALSGKIAALDDQAGLWASAAYYLGIDECTTDPADAQKILDVLAGQKPHLLLYGSSGTVDRTIAGEVVMHQMWNGAANKVRRSVPTARYIYPEEGIPQWQDNLAIPTGAPHPENAKAYINFIMDRKNAAAITNFTGYMNSLSGTTEFIKPEIANDPAVNTPAEFLDRMRPGVTCSPEMRELRSRVWAKLKK